MWRLRSMALAAIAPLLAGSAGRLEAQTSMRPLGPAGAVTVELMRPDMRDAGLKTGSGVAFAGASLLLRSNAALLLELPFARATFDAAGDPLAAPTTSAAIGNPYIGVLLPLARGSIELGTRLPLAPDDEEAGALVFFSDLDRMEAFVPDLLTLRAIGTFMTETGDGASLSLFAGPIAWVGTGRNRGETEFMLSYGGHGAYDAGAARLSAGATGRMVMSEAGSVSERTMHQAVASASFGRGAVRPGVQLSVPLDQDRRDFGASWAAGVYLSILLRR